MMGYTTFWLSSINNKYGTGVAGLSSKNKTNGKRAPGVVASGIVVKVDTKIIEPWRFPRATSVKM
jgi:hypothetical protein